MQNSRAVVLLDIDGVLNPRVVDGKLVVDGERAALVTGLAELGEVVWATTWSAAHTVQLSRDLGLPRQSRSIAFPVPIHVDPRSPAPTPKLHWVDRWLSRSVTAATAVVWIDDQLRADAREWADAQSRPVQLVQPEPRAGLTRAELETVRGFLHG